MLEGCAAARTWRQACAALAAPGADDAWKRIVDCSPKDTLWHSLRNCVAYQAGVWQNLLAKGVVDVIQPAAFKLAIVLRHTPPTLTARLLAELLIQHPQSQDLSSYVLALLTDDEAQWSAPDEGSDVDTEPETGLGGGDEAGNEGGDEAESEAEATNDPELAIEIKTGKVSCANENSSDGTATTDTSSEPESITNTTIDGADTEDSVIEVIQETVVTVIEDSVDSSDLVAVGSTEATVSATPEVIQVESATSSTTSPPTPPSPPGPAPLRDLQLFGDCELAVLGASREEYDAHAKLVRAEYSKLSTKSYVELRVKVLNQLSRIPKLYHSPEFECFEAKARENIERELCTLREHLRETVN